MYSYASNRETWPSTLHALLFYQNYGSRCWGQSASLLIGEDELADSDIGLAALLVDSFARAIAGAEETAFVGGTGHDNNQPEGFTADTTLTAATITTTAVGAVTIEKFLEMIYTCLGKFRKGVSFLGYPIHTQDDMATLAGTEGVIAAFENFMVGYRILDHTSNMSVQRLAELYAEAGLIGFKVHKRVGGYCIRPANKSIVLLTTHA